MLSIPEVLAILLPILSESKINILAQICQSAFVQPHRITTTSLSRTTQVSLRTLERFYAEANFCWLPFSILLFKNFLWDETKTYLLVFDETVEQKSGKATFGLAKFYSSLFQKVIPSISLMGMSLIDLDSGKSIPLILRLLKSKKSKQEEARPKKNKHRKGKVGRPKGSKNKPYQEPESATFQLVKLLIQDLLAAFAQFTMNVQITHAVADSYFGNKHYLKLIEKSGFHFISKFRKNTNLVFPYEGIQNALGRRKHLGNKVNFAKLPNKFRLEPKGAQKEEFKDSFIYQFHAYHKNIPAKLLNIIVLVNKKDTRKYAILISSDLELDAFTLIQYYRLRFQIEFSFREAKQYFGISHFQNYKENQVKFATQFAFFMVLLSRILLDSAQKTLEIERLSIRDLKSFYRASYIGNYFLNTSENTPKTIFNTPELRAVARWEAVNL